MSAALLTSLPSDIPGLLRRGSPLDNGMTVYEVRQEARWCGAAKFNDRAHWHLRDVALDLTDKTGRWHAALWASKRARNPSGLEWAALTRALSGDDMTLAEIDTLAQLVLRLAGRTP